jgi:hypothetical protein
LTNAIKPIISEEIQYKNIRIKLKIMSKNIRNFVFKKRRVFKKYRNTGEEKFLTLFNKIYSKIGSILEEF